ncbi:MAG: hypothetical protein EAZ20_09635 [Bacteroidetes bacterium]|nr:MAG: hypothetical protein EAZ20_09635 [Bacteroidota bacterium]
MKISVKNLGTIKEGEISLDKELTIFTGENNSGKSYMMYFNYGVLDVLFSINKGFVKKFGKLLELSLDSTKLTNGVKINLKDVLAKYFEICFKAIEESNTDELYQVIFQHKINDLKFEINDVEKIFLSPSYQYLKKLEGAKLKIFSKNYMINVDDEFITILTEDEYNLEDITKSLALIIVQSIDSQKKYFVPAERTAINTFYSDIMKQKASESEDLIVINNTDEIKNKVEELRKEGKMLPYAPLALMRYIKFAYDFRKYISNPLTEFADLATELEHLLGGGVSVSTFGDLQFQPTNQENQIPLYLSSSLVKSWSGIVIYLRHLAQKSDILMIDEPEINLHPKTQVLIARFLAKMINRGIRIIVSTHSDYILRELSTLIILNRDFEGKEKLMKRYNYQDNNTLSEDKIAVYSFGNQTITNIPITSKGIETDSIDEVITRQNEISDMVYYDYLDTLPEQV